MGKRTLYSLESDIRRILEGNDFISTNDESGKQWYMNLVTDLAIFVQQELEKAKIEVLEKVLEKKTNYEIEREEHGYRVTLEYVLADDIKKEIKLLKEKE